MDVYSLLSIVKSYYRPDNYDLHNKLCIASKKYYEFTIDMKIDEYFDATVEQLDMVTTYKVCGLTHRLYKPAYIIYDENGIITQEVYYKNDKIHRDNELFGTTYYSKPAIIEYYGNDLIYYEEYYIDGEIHREDGPAYIEYNSDGYVTYETYYKNGEIHRDNELIGTIYHSRPAKIEYDEYGSIIRERYYINGKLHREDRPATIEYDESRSVIYEDYYINGKRHRVNGPAIIEYYSNNLIKREMYYMDDKLHRDGELIRPACIYYNMYGHITDELYYFNDELHRADGPAHIKYDHKGTIISEEYCIKGVRKLKRYVEQEEPKYKPMIYENYSPCTSDEE